MWRRISISVAVAAAVVVASQQARASQCVGSVTSFSKSADRSDSFGNDFASAGYDAYFSIDADKQSSSGQAGVDADATVLGHQFQLFSVSGWAQSTLGGDTGVGATVAVAGQDILCEQASKTFSKTWSKSTNFGPKVSAHFAVGPVPMSVSLQAKGSIGFTIDAGITVDGITLTATPWGKAYLVAKAGADIFVASAGVRGSLTLVEASAPGRGSVGVANGQITWHLDDTVTVTSLQGKISLYAEVIFLGESDLDLISWDGWTKSWQLINASGCVGLI